MVNAWDNAKLSELIELAFVQCAFSWGIDISQEVPIFDICNIYTKTFPASILNIENVASKMYYGYSGL